MHNVQPGASCQDIRYVVNGSSIRPLCARERQRQCDAAAKTVRQEALAARRVEEVATNKYEETQELVSSLVPLSSDPPSVVSDQNQLVGGFIIKFPKAAALTTKWRSKVQSLSYLKDMEMLYGASTTCTFETASQCARGFRVCRCRGRAFVGTVSSMLIIHASSLKQTGSLIQDEKMDALREDIENLEQEAQRHEARVAASEQRAAELGQQIADLPPAPQVRCPQPVTVPAPSPCRHLTHTSRSSEHGLSCWTDLGSSSFTNLQR